MVNGVGWANAWKWVCVHYVPKEGLLRVGDLQEQGAWSLWVYVEHSVTLLIDLFRHVDPSLSRFPPGRAERTGPAQLLQV